MKTLILGLALALAMSSAQPRRAPAMFDPAGTWTYSTHDDGGAPISGSIEISGMPGAYTGVILSGTDRRIPISDVLTSPNGMVVIANLPDNGGAAVIKVWKDANGKLQAGWGPIRAVIPATIERAK